MPENNTETNPNGSPQPPQPPSQPQSRFFTQAEVDDLVNRVRRDEKTKLYDDLESARKKNEELSTELSTLRPLADRTKNLESEVQTLRDGGKKIEDAVEKRLSEALTKQEKEFEEKLRLAKLAGYRDKLLASISDPDAVDFISDLVTGNTEEEIKAAFDKAKARYDKIVEKTAAAKEEEVKKQFKGTLPNAVQPGTTADPNAAPTAPQSTGMKDFMRMSPKDREAKIAEMKKTVFADAGVPLGDKG